MHPPDQCDYAIFGRHRDHLVLDSTVDGTRLFPFELPSFGSRHGCPYTPTHEGLMRIITLTTISIFLLAASAHAAVITFGDQDCLGFGCYGATDPTSGATLQGLSPNAVTIATNSFGHSFPFSPSGDFAGTDQIYVGSVQTGAHDGYSGMPVRINGPQTLVLNYSSLVSGGT